MDKFHRATLFAGLFVAFLASGTAQQVRPELNPQQIEEAIQLGGDDKRARAFLDQYVLQTRAGWGDGPLIGNVSTPFSRVVQAAVAARKKGMPFSSADVAPELILPELHVVTTSQPSTDEGMIATVTSVVVVPLGSNSSQAVQPSKTVELTKEYQAFNGISFDRTGLVAIFPMTALARNNEVHVIFDRIARGSNALSTCRECVVRLNATRIR